MLGPSPQNGLALKLVMLHAVRPKDLLSWARVCTHWRNELRKNEYWYRFRTLVLSRLAVLKPIFSHYPNNAPIWRIFAKCIWPVARDLQHSSMFFDKLNTHIISAVMESFIPMDETIVEIQAQNPIGYMAHTLANVKIESATKKTTLIYFYITETNRDMLKKLGLKRLKSEKTKRLVYCNVIVRDSNKQVIMQYNLSVKDFFKPFLKNVFCA